LGIALHIILYVFFYSLQLDMHRSGKITAWRNGAIRCAGVGGVISIYIPVKVVFIAMNRTKDSAVESMSWACERLSLAQISPVPSTRARERLGFLGHRDVVIGPSAAVMPKISADGRNWGPLVRDKSAGCPSR
jgi:hypothetical protein